MSSWQAFSISFEVERDDLVELTIEGNVEPSVPANFRGHPDNWAPAEGGESEITAITIKDEAGKAKRWDGKLTSTESDDALEQLRDAAADYEPDFDPPEPDYD